MIRVRVYTDQFDHVQVEVNGRIVTVGYSIDAWLDNEDIEGFVRQIIRGIISEIPDLVEVGDG